MTSPTLPKSLQVWFIIHFLADVIVAIPLFIFPVALLKLFGWHSIDPLAARIVAAALFGIGIESLLGRNASIDSFKNMLNLKIIWSASATIGIFISIIQSAYATLVIEWLLLLIFILFHILWVYYRIRIGRLLSQ